MKRYNLVLHEEVFDAVQAIAAKRHITTLEVFRKFIRLGLLVDQAESTPGNAFVLREGDREREVLLL